MVKTKTQLYALLICITAIIAFLVAISLYYSISYENCQNLLNSKQDSKVDLQRDTIINYIQKNYEMAVELEQRIGEIDNQIIEIKKECIRLPKYNKGLTGLILIFSFLELIIAFNYLQKTKF